MLCAVCKLLLIGILASSCSADEISEIATPSTPNPVQSESPSSQPRVYNPDEVQLAKLINSHRVAIGDNPLALHDYVSQAASGHNDYMIAKGELSHDLFGSRADGLTRALGAYNIG